MATVDLASEERDPLAEAKALARTGEDDIVTMARCPLCAGQGMVPPEVAATFDGLCRDLKART